VGIVHHYACRALRPSHRADLADLEETVGAVPGPAHSVPYPETAWQGCRSCSWEWWSHRSSGRMSGAGGGTEIAFGEYGMVVGSVFSVIHP